MTLYLKNYRDDGPAKKVADVIGYKSELVLQPEDFATKADPRPIAVNSYIKVSDVEKLKRYSAEEKIELWVEIRGVRYYGQGKFKALDTQRDLAIIETPVPLFNAKRQFIDDII